MTCCKIILFFVCTLCIFTQGASSPDLSTVYVDLRALRNDRVTLVEKGSPHSLCLMESGKVGLILVISPKMLCLLCPRVILTGEAGKVGMVTVYKMCCLADCVSVIRI